MIVVNTEFYPFVLTSFADGVQSEDDYRAKLAAAGFVDIGIEPTRVYSDADVHQLRFIRLCRAMDMSLDEVRTLLGLDLRRKA